MKGLYDEHAISIQQRLSNTKHSLNGFFSEQCEITNNNIYRDTEFSSSKLLIGKHAKITATGMLSYFDQPWHDVYANNMDILNGEFTSQPAFTTTNVEHGTRRTAQYCI